MGEDSSAADLGPDDTNQCPIPSPWGQLPHFCGDIYVRHLADETTSLVSSTPDDSDAGNEASWLPPSGLPLWTPDGSRLVYISTATDLVRADTNGAWDVFIAAVDWTGTAESGDADHPAVRYRRCTGHSVRRA